MSGACTHLATVGSTNDWLLANADTLGDGHWVRADRQTAGRGRRGRVWNDGAGNLMTSVLVRAAGPNAGKVQQLSFVAAVALLEAVAEVTSPLAGEVDSRVSAAGEGWPALPTSADPSPGPPFGRLSTSPARGEVFSLKWPNDLLLHGTKCAGILLERQGDWLVIGFGVNLAHHPQGTERPATSLAAAGLPVPPPQALQAALASAFSNWRAIWAHQGFAPIRAAWLAHAAGLGQRLVARLGDENPEGVFTGLADDGALLLQLDDGAVRAIHAGEVFAV